MRTVAPEVSRTYIPHAVNSAIFRPANSENEKEKVAGMRESIISTSSEENNNPKKKIFFWNNRNARRKHPGTLVWWFKEFLDEVGHDKATLIMHTDPRDQHGQDLPHLVEHLGLDNGQVLLSSV